MAPLLILAGVPRPVFNRHRLYSPALKGWEIAVFPAQHRRSADLRTCWSDVMSAADGANEEGVHILAFHFSVDQHSRFESELRDRHRLIWMDRQSLTSYGTDSFTQTLQTRADFEMRWRCELRPRSARSGLVLPESSFTPVAAAKIWQRVRRVTATHDDVGTIAALTRHFRQRHWKRRLWRDARDLEFDPFGAKHARAETGMRWKFTYLVPLGFHFDVKHRRRQADITVTDANGKVHRFGSYTNVDCHGFVRGGR